MIVLGAGTGGTITGVARKMKEKCPNVKVKQIKSITRISVLQFTRERKFTCMFTNVQFSNYCLLVVIVVP